MEHNGRHLEESEERALCRAAAEAGKEVPADLLSSAPLRTLYCDGRDFKRLRSLALTGRPLSVCCVPMISPLSVLYRIWTIIANITDLTYTAFIVALSIAFNESAEFQTTSFLDWCDLIGSAVFFIDILMGFQTGVVARWDTRAVVVRDGRNAAHFYIFHGTFLIDVIASLPAIMQLLVRLTGAGHGALQIFYIIRLLRLLRVVRLLRNITPGRGAGPMQGLVALLPTNALIMFNALFSLAVLVNVMGCLWWNVAVNAGLENSWAAVVSVNKNIDLINGTNPQRWLVCIYYALTTVATIGYGDITPVTIQEVGVTILFEVVGVAFFGFAINVATSILSASGPSARRAAAVKEKMQDVEFVLRSMDMPKSLKRKIRLYFSEQWLPPNDAAHDLRFQLYWELPTRLRTRLVRQKMERPLAELGFLPATLTHRQRRQVHHILACCSVPMLLACGKDLAEAVPEVPEGDSSRVDLSSPCIYILDEGEMCVLRPGDHAEHAVVDQHRIGDKVDFTGPAVIGLMALFSPDVSPLAASAAAAAASAAAGTDAAAAGTDAAAAPGGTPAVAAGGPAAATADRNLGGDDGGGGGDGGSRSSSSGSSKQEEAEDEEEEEVKEGGTCGGMNADAGLGPAWQQHALALTECHLWRVNCRQLFQELFEKQPWVLKHLLDRLLCTLGVAAGSDPASSILQSCSGRGSGAAAGPSRGATFAAPEQQAAERVGHGYRSGAANRLLHLRADLTSAVAAAKQRLHAEQAAAGASGMARASSPFTQDSWGTLLSGEGAVGAELAGVSVVKQAEQWASPDVWQPGESFAKK